LVERARVALGHVDARRRAGLQRQQHGEIVETAQRVRETEIHAVDERDGDYERVIVALRFGRALEFARAPLGLGEALAARLLLLRGGRGLAHVLLARTRSRARGRCGGRGGDGGGRLALQLLLRLEQRVRVAVDRRVQLTEAQTPLVKVLNPRAQRRSEFGAQLWGPIGGYRVPANMPMATK
jgi:hypothetical protein